MLNIDHPFSPSPPSPNLLLFKVSNLSNHCPSKAFYIVMCTANTTCTLFTGVPVSTVISLYIFAVCHKSLPIDIGPYIQYKIGSYIRK